MKKILSFIAIALMGMTTIFAQTPNYQGIIYVTPTGAGTHSGDSWANATSSIDTAQTLAQANNAVVWVAAGVYYGDTTATAENAFVMTEGVNVYGGFAGNEPDSFDLTLRDFEMNETILDGDSARRVLYQPNNFNTETIWDGFTIQHGYLTIGYGAGVKLKGQGCLSYCLIQYNTLLGTFYQGGGVDAENSTVSNCKITNNNNNDGYGGGVYASYSTIYNCQITSNSAMHNGGIRAFYSNVTNCHIIGNNTTHGSSGIFARYSIVNDCLITDNATDGNGGGVYASNSSINNCEITGNTASHGGGLYASEFSIVSNCNIMDNTSDIPGGGVYITDHSSINNCHIIGNSSGNYGGGAYVSNSSTIIDCYIVNNTGYFGGGAYVSDSSTIIDCYIVNNIGYYSGGVRADNSIITGCEIIANKSGGGVFANGSTVSNCLIANNKSMNRYNAGGVNANNTRITNSTIVRNSYGAVDSLYSAGVNLDEYSFLANSIVWGNENNGEVINLIGNGTCSYSAIEGDYVGDSIITLSADNLPMFIHPSLTSGVNDTTLDVDWHLSENSPCINYGNNFFVDDSLDLDGMPRIKRNTVDLGCYESDYCNDITFSDTTTTVCELFNWHQYQGLTESGDYIDTLVNATGCDSIITLHLTVNPTEVSEFSVTTPDSCYTWNGVDYCESGTYTQTLQTFHGCDSVVTLHLTIAVGVDDHNQGAAITVYPNPTSGVIHVQLTMNNVQLKNVEIQLYDAFGRLLQTTGGVRANNHSPLQTAQIDLSPFVPGIYFIKAVAESNVLAIRKVVKR